MVIIERQSFYLSESNENILFAKLCCCEVRVNVNYSRELHFTIGHLHDDVTRAVHYGCSSFKREF